MRPILSIANLRTLPDAMIFGTIGRTMREYLQLQREIARHSAPLVRGRLLLRPLVFTCTPEAAHDVLVTKAKSFEKAPAVRILLNDLVGQGLFTSDGSLWRTQRKLMSPLLRARRHADLAHQVS